MRERPRPVADPRRLHKREAPHCGRDGCRCTHSDGCEYGWIEAGAYTDAVTLQTYSPVEPCPVCRPEATARRIEGSRPEPDPPPAPSEPRQLTADDLQLELP